jgi:hypothetical protein
MLQDELYPYSFQFNIATFHNDFTVKDITGATRAYVKQKMFKLKEHVRVFTDESETQLAYDIRADRWLDFNTVFSFHNPDGINLGKLVRKGWKSIWKASYELYDENDMQDLLIQEKNPWVKVCDTLLSEIPIVGMLTGYFFNPSYSVKRPDGTLVCSFTKNASFFGRKFSLIKENPFEQGEEERIKLGLMMMVLLEKRRG